MYGNNELKNLDQTLLNLFDALNDRPIVYHGIYSQILGTTSAGLLVSQLIYWSKIMNHQQFYKTDVEICDELKMGSKELRNAKKKVIESGVFEVKIKGVPPKTYYKINIKKLIGLVSDIQTKHNKTGQINLAQRDKLKYPEGTNQFSPKGQIITEMSTEITKEKNNRTKSTKYAMAATKKSKLHVEQIEPTVKHESKPKLELTKQAQLEPVGPVVVDSEIDKLVKMVQSWAISKVLIENWVKKHGVGYILQKIELTKSAITLSRVKNRGAYLNKAIELDWLPPAPKEDEEEQAKPIEPLYPTHEENVTWYSLLPEIEKRKCLKYALNKHAHFEKMLESNKADICTEGFLTTPWFKMMMQLVGRAA